MSDETQGTAETLAEGTTAEAVSTEGTAEQQVAEGAEGEADAGEAGGDKPEAEATERKRLSGAQRQKRRETFLLNQLAEKDRENEELRQSRGANGTQSTTDQPPKEEDFPNDWGGYIAAKAAHEVKQSLKATASEREGRDRAAAQQTELRERVVEFEERADDLRDVVKDYDKVIKSVGVTVREELAREVLFSEKGPLLQYHLAQNPDELHRLNGLTGRELAKQIGRLEATLKVPEAKKQTTAPAPLARLSGGAAPSFDAEKAGMSAYAKDFERRMKAEQG